MLFDSIKIINFRSFGLSGTEIKFPSSNYSVAIGFNSSGKSSLLQAIGIVLGIYPFSKFQPEESDFHKFNTAEDMLIELRLKTPLNERDVYQKEFQIWGFRYRVYRAKRGTKGIFKSEHHCIDINGDTILKSERIYRKPKEGEELNNAKIPLYAADYAWKLGQGFYLEPQALDHFFDKTTGWSPLGRLFDLYREDFPGVHNKHDLAGKSIRSEDAFKSVAGELAEILKTDKLRQIEQKVSEKVDVLMSAGGGLRVSLAIPKPKEIFEYLVNLNVCERPYEIEIPASKLGSGYRALLRLAVLESYLELTESNKCILLIEEPEVYLHAHLERHFATILRKLADLGHQVLLTTHSEHFVDLSSPSDVLRLSKNPLGETTIHHIPDTLHLALLKFGQKLAAKGNEEIFFCNHALLVEGQDDKVAVAKILEILGVNINLNNISVIDCGGAEQIPSYVRFCYNLGIDFFVIHDLDDETEPNFKSRNDNLRNVISGLNITLNSLAFLDPDLEGSLGITKSAKNNWQKVFGTLAKSDANKIKSDFPIIYNPLTSFIESRAIKM